MIFALPRYFVKSTPRISSLKCSASGVCLRYVATASALRSTAQIGTTPAVFIPRVNPPGPENKSIASMGESVAGTQASDRR